MTLEEFGRFLQSKSVGRIESPVSEHMVDRVYSGMKYIGSITTPMKWIVNSPEGYEVMRRIDANTWLRYPEKPIINDVEQLDLEESLYDALALHVMAGLETQRSKVNMGMFYAEIDLYNSKLIETYLEIATNDAPRYYVFP